MRNTLFPFPPAAFTGKSRRVDVMALFDWLAQGWAVFSARPLPWMGMGGVYFASLLLAPLLRYGALLLGFLLLPLAANLFLACDRLVRAEASADRPIFFPLRLNRRVGLLTLHGILALGLICAFLQAGFTFLLAGIGQQSLQGSWSASLGMLVALALFLPLAFLLSQALCLILSFALLLTTLHAMPTLPALAASGMACAKNWRVLILFVAQLTIMWILACLPAGLGLPVLIPVLFATLHAAYRDIFVGV
jgi:uncharacterized membrane protein